MHRNAIRRARLSQHITHGIVHCVAVTMEPFKTSILLIFSTILVLVTPYELDSNIVDKFGELLLNQYENDLDNIQVGTQIRYGCWCLFEVQQFGANETVLLQKEGKGGAVDEIDRFCKL